MADKIFDSIDADKSGTIDADELLKHLLEAGVDSDEISDTFAAIDVDRDGAITREEWRAGYARYLAALPAAEKTPLQDNEAAEEHIENPQTWQGVGEFGT